MRVHAGVVVVGVLVALGVGILWLRSAGEPRGLAPTGGASTSTPAAAAPRDPQLEQARLHLEQMKTALSTVQVAPRVEVKEERRPGESDELFTERTRAIAEFRHLITAGKVPPDREQALMRVFADAQENWRLALQQAGRQQPDSPSAVMADPVLAPIYTGIYDDAMRAAKAQLEPNQAAILHSFVPSLLPFVRTRPFERSP
jgi:hypothetical protein